MAVSDLLHSPPTSGQKRIDAVALRRSVSVNGRSNECDDTFAIRKRIAIGSRLKKSGERILKANRIDSDERNLWD